MAYEAEDIALALGGRDVLENVRLRLAAGEVVALIGPNGAGKSTALKALSGEIAPRAGRVLLDGRDIRELRAGHMARRRAVLAQANAPGFAFTVLETVRLGAEAGGAAPANADALALESLEKVELEALAGRDISALSGGEAQRVHLARALAQVEAAWRRAPGTAPYLLLDEPTASLDLEHQLLVLAVIREHAGRGGGVLVTLHDLNLAAMAADRLVAMRAGRVVAQGPAETVLTADLVRDLYRVDLSVSQPPAAPFVLPQTARRAAARREDQLL